MGLQKFGLVGLLLIATSLLAISTVPGAVGVSISDVGIAPQQGSGMVMVTVLNCAGNPIPNAPAQLRGVTWSQWTYTGPNGVATISAPPGAYTLQGGINGYPFSQLLNVGGGVVAVTVRIGAGCSISSFPTQATITYTSYGIVYTSTP